MKYGNKNEIESKSIKYIILVVLIYKLRLVEIKYSTFNYFYLIRVKVAKVFQFQFSGGRT